MNHSDDPDSPGLASLILTGFSFLLVLATLPFSLFTCVKVFFQPVGFVLFARRWCRSLYCWWYRRWCRSTREPLYFASVVSSLGEPRVQVSLSPISFNIARIAYPVFVLIEVLNSSCSQKFTIIQGVFFTGTP